MSSENLEKVLAMARKLKALAERGIDGEKDAAEKKYKEYLEEHGLTDSDINPEMNKRFFEVKDADYKDVLLNVILSVNPYTKHVDVANGMECYLDHEDYTEVLKKYEYFSKLFRMERELLITAFITKHQPAFEPDAKAIKKWRERRVENVALNVKKQESQTIKEEYNRIQSDKALGVNVQEKIMESNDRLAITAFNRDRVSELQSILLDAEYVRSHTRIGNDEGKTKWSDWLNKVKDQGNNKD